MKIWPRRWHHRLTSPVQRLNHLAAVALLAMWRGRQGGLAFAEEMREHDFMGEERRPFKGGGAVSIGAAEEFVLAVGLANQFGVAELADDLAAVALGDDVFQFHTPPRYATG